MAVRRDRGSRAVGRMSIGALSKATGVPVETLRTWELRYGFPEPERKPSGHRVYPAAIVPRLRRISEALRRGHRAGETVTASDRELDALLKTTPVGERPAPSGLAAASVTVPELLQAVERFDRDRLTRLLLTEAARLGVVEFLESRVAPVIEAVGEAWEAGHLEVRHEHFLSERVGDLLRSLRMPAEDRASGPLVVCATLPGEAHGLGLQMAALVLASAGCRTVYVGTDVPIDEIVRAVRQVDARAVALSVSVASRDSARRDLAALRALLPRRVLVVAGGKGAPEARRGIEAVADLRALDQWARRQLALTAVS